MKEKILIVEDDKELRSMLEEILGINGYLIFTATDADDAFKKLESGMIPDLIISDIMMPGKSGLEFLEEFKKKYKNTYIPFVFLTAKTEDSDVRRGMNLGAEDYLKKPFKVKDLLKSVELRLKKQKDVSEKMEPLSRALGLNIPHELKTPLIPIIGYSDLMLDDLTSMSKAQITQYLQCIKSSGSKISGRINKLLVFQALEIQDVRNEFKLYKYMSTTKASVQKVIPWLCEISEKYKRPNDFNHDCDPAVLSISFEHLKIVFSELLENAFNFSSANSAVTVTGRKEKSFYVFSITDYGAGISEKGIANILSHPQSLTCSYEDSTGLGLAIVIKILKIYDSQLNIQSKLSEGTTISFTLDIKQQ